ncbi:hypothetical protein LN047_09565 [Achromobacter sp. JD417]|uniref:hypothetical protein n=1 Tax=Achromobacter sp. JD417 TaxID=2893881 RepID=UPI0035A628E0
MNDLITWANLGKLAVAGVGVYVIQPALLVLRDGLLWKLIDKFVLNQRLDDEIDTLVTSELMLSNLPKTSSVSWVSGEAVCKIDGKVVTAQEAQDHMNAWSYHGQRVEKANAFVATRRRRIDWILRHYKQPEQANPVDERLAASRKWRREVEARPVPLHEL